MAREVKWGDLKTRKPLIHKDKMQKWGEKGTFWPCVNGTTKMIDYPHMPKNYKKDRKK